MSPLFNRKVAYLHRVRSQQRNKMLNDFGYGISIHGTQSYIKLGRFFLENDLTLPFRKNKSKFPLNLSINRKKIYPILYALN